MKFNKKFLLSLLIIAFLSACGGASTDEQVVADTGMTQAVGSMVASFFGTQTAMYTPPPTSTITPLPTNTFWPTPTPAPANALQPPPTWTPGFVFYTNTPSLVNLTPSVTGTLPTATANSGALAYGCNNLAFIRNVDYPPGTEVAPEEEFTKTWKVENTGTCDWMFVYTLSIVSDEYFDSSWNTLGKIVSPGEWTELSVIVTAPKHPGTYTGYWRFSDGAHPFGATLGLTIVVK